MTTESLAQRIENAADPERYCTAVAVCLERNGGDLEGAIELAETIQMDELFERHHPREGDGKFRNKSERMKAKHAREREMRRPERRPRDTGPKSGNRQAVEQAMQDPDLRQQLVDIASKIGKDIRSQLDPEDVVQSALVRAAKEADELELTDVHGWLRTLVARELKDATKGARAFKRRGGAEHESLDEELDHAERAGQTHGLDPAIVIGRAIGQLPDKERKLLTAYYGLRQHRQNFNFTDAQRQAAQRARAKIKPIIDEMYGSMDEPSAPRGTMEDVPGIPTGEFAPGPKRKPAENRPPEDRRWRTAGVTAAAHEGKIWHRKAPEHVAVEKLASHLNLSPEQTHAIHNIVRKTEQFDETNSVDPVPDTIATLSASSAAAAMDKARLTIRDLLKKNAPSDPRVLTQIEAALRAVQPTIERILAESSLAGAVRGADDVLSSAPPPPGGWDFGAPNVPDGGKLLFPEGDEPIVRFPILEAAAERLAKASIISPHEFYKLGADARQNAFTISGDLTRESVEKIKDVLAENAYAAPSGRDFVDTVEGLFGEGMPLSRAHLEQVFRNNVNGAWSDGHDKALRHPIVADAFPYRAINATHDQRVRDTHLVLEHAGLSGTNIYHKDDPAFQTLRGPWEWGCRCSWHGVSVPQAAAKGVEHAQRWMASAEEQGLEPEQLPFAAEFVDWPTLNGERIMPPPEWQRSAVQFDHAYGSRNANVSAITKPRQQGTSWQKPVTPAYNVPPRNAQIPSEQPLPQASGMKWGKNAGVAPLPHAHHLAGQIDELRRRYPRLATLPDITASVDLQLRPDQGGFYRRGKRRLIVGGVPGEIHRGVLPNRTGETKPHNVTSSLQSWPEAERHADRHEYGHHLYENASDDERNEWAALHQEHLPDLNVISGYGAGSPTESFAESFGLYTHPGYGQDEHLPRLPPQLEDYFRRVLGQGEQFAEHKSTKMSKPIRVYRIHPHGAKLHGVETETSNGEPAGGVHVFESLPEVVAAGGWLNDPNVELAEVECDPRDVVPNEDYEGALLRKGRGRIVKRKKFRDTYSLAKWAEQQTGGG